MEAKYNLYKSSTKIPIAGLVLVALIVTAICSFYVFALKNTLRDENKTYLSELSAEVSTLVDHRVDFHFKNLEAIALICSEFAGRENALTYLKLISDELGYVWLGAADKNGILYTTSGAVLDFSNESIIQNAIQGNRDISALRDEPAFGEPVMLYSVPVKNQEGEPVGAIAGCVAKSSMQQAISSNVLGGAGYCQIIDYDGNIILSSLNKEAEGSEMNFFDRLRGSAVGPDHSLAQMQRDMQDDRSGILYYTPNGGQEKKVASYTPWGSRNGICFPFFRPARSKAKAGCSLICLS